MKGFLLFFDNQFLRRLLSSPRDIDHERWQKFFFEKLNKEFLPLTILTTPFKFLEVLGVIPKERSLATYPFRPSDERLNNVVLAEEISHRNAQIIEKSIDFYSQVPELRLAHYQKRIDYMLQNQVGKSKFHQLLADDIMIRFSKIDDLESLIWSYLAVDDLQGVLLRVGESRLFQMAQLQTLRDLLAMISDGYNMSCFRLLRSMWCSIEGQVLNRGYKSIVPLKRETDLADVDYVHYATVGGYHHDTLRTMTIFTCDDKAQVETRLKIAKQLFLLFGQEILSKSLRESAAGIPKYRHGRVFTCDPKIPKCEIVRVKNLSPQYELPEGALNAAMVERMKMLAHEDAEDVQIVNG